MSVVTRRSWILAGQLALLGALAAPVQAQSNASGSIAITATLVTPLQLIVSHPLDFGRLLTPGTKTIAPSASTSGRFEILGQGGSAVTLTLSMPASLSPTGGGTNLPVSNWTYVSSETTSLTGTPIPFTSGTSAPIPFTLTTFNGSVKMYFAIGATVTASALNPTGAYTGTGQITTAYTDL
jgi:hypothetical protein